MAEFSERAPRYIVICGPTACGKSALALELARKLGGEIICADSMQVYRGLEIGTAAPTPEERESVPHRLYGFLDPAMGYSVARYVEDARAAIEECARGGAVPIVCGGTGLYVDLLCRGVEFEPGEPDESLRAEIREEYEKNGAAALVEELARADEAFAASLDVKNTKRLLRAVELLRTSGVTTSEQTARSLLSGPFGSPRRYLLAPGDRAALYARCESRVDDMMARGLLVEAEYVRQNRARFITAGQAIGYKELFPYLEGEAAIDDCIESLKRATRRFAKRQLTWFRRDSDSSPLDPDAKTTRELAEIIAKEWSESL